MVNQHLFPLSLDTQIESWSKVVNDFKSTNTYLDLSLLLQKFNLAHGNINSYVLNLDFQTIHILSACQQNLLQKQILKEFLIIPDSELKYYRDYSYVRELSGYYVFEYTVNQDGRVKDLTGNFIPTKIQLDLSLFDNLTKENQRTFETITQVQNQVIKFFNNPYRRTI